MQAIAVKFYPAQHLTGREDAFLNPSQPQRKPAAADTEHDRQHATKRRDLDRQQARRLKRQTYA